MQLKFERTNYTNYKTFVIHWRLATLQLVWFLCTNSQILTRVHYIVNAKLTSCLISKNLIRIHKSPVHTGLGYNPQIGSVEPDSTFFPTRVPASSEPRSRSVISYLLIVHLAWASQEFFYYNQAVLDLYFKFVQNPAIVPFSWSQVILSVWKPLFVTYVVDKVNGALHSDQLQGCNSIFWPIAPLIIDFRMYKMHQEK